MLENATQCPKLDRHYRNFLATEKSADFVDSVSRDYTLSTLEKLAEAGKKTTRRAATLAIGFLGDFHYNSVLGRALCDRDRAVRILADHGIRQLWFRVSHPTLESSLRKLVRLNQQRRFGEVISFASTLLEDHSQVAEIWNQRSVALYGLGDFAHAACDCSCVLQLNPYHFLAAVAAANCYLELDEVVHALDYFRMAIEINPDLELVRNHIAHLERIVKEN